MRFELDKSTWKKVIFGDVVKKVTNKIDPKTYHSDAVVEGGHIKKRDFHIRHCENKNTLGYLGPAFHMGFKKGQILYVSRNPHLMKVGFPQFDGICSNTTFILQTKNENILRNDLIPFIMHSDLFIEQSIKNVRGGVNPYVNWGDIANIEILLPPYDIQNDVSKVLWGSDDLLEKDMKVQSCLNDLFNSTRNAIFDSEESKHKLNIRSDSEHDEICLKSAMATKTLNGIYKSAEFQGSGVRIINMGELFAFPILGDQDMSLIELNEKEKQNFIVEEGDLIFARRSLVVEGAGKCSIVGSHSSPMTIESSMIRVRLDKNKFDPYYVFHFLNSKEGRRRMRRIVCFTTVAGIASSDLGNIKIPIVSLDRQKAIVEILDRISSKFDGVEKSISDARELKISLINKVF